MIYGVDKPLPTLEPITKISTTYVIKVNDANEETEEKNENAKKKMLGIYPKA